MCLRQHSHKSELIICTESSYTPEMTLVHMFDHRYMTLTSYIYGLINLVQSQPRKIIWPILSNKSDMSTFSVNLLLSSQIEVCHTRTCGVEFTA
jgi:hypothetical protein